jgi:hypothetical protein
LLSEHVTNLKDKLDIIAKNHSNYASVFERNLIKYDNTKTEVENLFDDII